MKTMNELTERFRGVFTALVTPFRDGAVDYAAYDALVERQIDAGIAGLVPVGTTGEAATLSDEEADALIARTVRLAAGRALVMAGAGANDTPKSVPAKPSRKNKMFKPMPIASGGTMVGRKNNNQTSCRPRNLRRPNVRAAGNASSKDKILAMMEITMPSHIPPSVRGSSRARSKKVNDHWVGKGAGKNQPSAKV